MTERNEYGPAPEGHLRVWRADGTYLDFAPRTVPPKEARDEWRRQANSETVMHSAVSEYVPITEFTALLDAVDELEAERDRLRAWLRRIGDLPDVDADHRGWMARDALEGKLP